MVVHSVVFGEVGSGGGGSDDLSVREQGVRHKKGIECHFTTFYNALIKTNNQKQVLRIQKKKEKQFVYIYLTIIPRARMGY